MKSGGWAYVFDINILALFRRLEGLQRSVCLVDKQGIGRRKYHSGHPRDPTLAVKRIRNRHGDSTLTCCVRSPSVFAPWLAKIHKVSNLFSRKIDPSHPSWFNPFP